MGIHPATQIPFSANFKNAWNYASTPTYIFTVWHLIKKRDNFAFLISYFVMRKVTKKKFQIANFAPENHIIHKAGLILLLN
jgi:hypothetical protein